jgi:hypothetical protein
MMVVSPFIINTPLQRGVLRAAETQNRFNFNGFYALSKTAEAVRTPPSHFYTPLKRGVNEKSQLRMTMLVKYSG